MSWKRLLKGLRFPEQAWQCCWTLIRSSLCVLFGSLTFTLSAVASQELGVRMGPAEVMWGCAGTSLGWPHHSQSPPVTVPLGAGELQGRRTSQGTQLRSDIPSLGLRSCCSFRPNTNRAEWLEVSQHAGTHTDSTAGLLCLIPLWHQRTVQSGVQCQKCAINQLLNSNHLGFNFY